jgi:hypothetical protein
MRPRTTSSAIATGSMAASSHADCAPMGIRAAGVEIAGLFCLLAGFSPIYSP